MRHNLNDRFWSKVERPDGPDACWEWQASRYRKGRNGRTTYGAFLYEGGTHHASRVAWLLVNGPIPDGLLVLHTCDNPPCVRPTHLFLGTHHDNHLDMVRKERSTKGRPMRDGCMPRGEARWNSRLTVDDVRTIRRRLAAGESRVVLASEFGVTRGGIRSVAVGKSWAWLTD